MYTIWKTRLEGRPGEQQISVPTGAEMLCAGADSQGMAVWYRCDGDAAKIARTLIVAWTGRAAPPPEQARYLGTAQTGPIVWHVFEKL